MSADSGLILPEREAQPTPVSRKTQYLSNDVSFFDFADNGVARKGYASNTTIRLTRVVGRPQETNGVNRLVVSLGIVTDGEVIGLIEGDTETPHPMYTDPRYAAWNDRSKRPHRINATQWVQVENNDLVRALVNHLHKAHGWSVITNPAKGRDRTTTDLFVCRPAAPVEDPSTMGVYIDGFEVSVNPDYADGFRSFYEGVESQRKRWEAAIAQQNPAMRTQALARVAENIHFLGGTYPAGPQGDPKVAHWARPVDVGMVMLDGEEFFLYRSRSGGELSEDLFAGLVAGNLAAKSAPPRTATAPEALDLEPEDFR